MFLLLVIFISVPLIEIYLFILIGEFIGSLKTIILVILTAIIGGFVIKKEGVRTLHKLKFALMKEPKDFIEAISKGFFIVISGILLITPGFATDLFGLILFLRHVRIFIIKIFLNKIKLSKISEFDEKN